MKFANLNGRAVVLGTNGAVDVEEASGGAIPSDPTAAVGYWDALVELARDVAGRAGRSYEPRELGAPVPWPRQSIGIALNYRAHAMEAGFEIPEIPLLFTKFPGGLAGPNDDILVPTDTTDYEVELVVVMGRDADRVSRDEAIACIAGFAVGQDISERTVQRTRPGPQHTLAKSYRSFGPWGPAITTLDELDDPFDLRISCALNGETMQDSTTADLIFDVPALISFISTSMPLFPGDVIFTGTPSGVGSRRTPPRFLADGDELVSSIEGLGTLHNHCRSVVDGVHAG